MCVGVTFLIVIFQCVSIVDDSATVTGGRLAGWWLWWYWLLKSMVTWSFVKSVSSLVDSSRIVVRFVSREGGEGKGRERRMEVEQPGSSWNHPKSEASEEREGRRVGNWQYEWLDPAGCRLYVRLILVSSHIKQEETKVRILTYKVRAGSHRIITSDSLSGL
ncbi:hypothetical protein M0802_006163 [Mischocyttarus mexicanus]|nr:hypothetical protein M0802_006163 [Mischocyttarus mexicanus]